MTFRYFVALVLTALLLAGCDPVGRKARPTCKDPRNAANSVFLWQTGETQRLREAATCFEAAGRTQAELEQSARRLKRVYDYNDAYVRMDAISDEPGYVDPETKRAEVVPHQLLPDVVLEKKAGRWLWTQRSLDRIDELYEAEIAGLDQLIDRIPSWARGKVLQIEYWQYLALVLLVGLGLVVRKVLQVVVAARIKRLGEHFGQDWATGLVDVIASPGATLVTAIILRVGYPQLHLQIDVHKALATTVRILITLSVVWAIYNAVDLLGTHLQRRATKTESRLDDQLVPMLRKSLKLAIFTVGTLVVLQNLGLDITTMLAGLSIGGIAIGLAAKDTLANFFGSISIFVDSPFQIGDWIHVDGVDGTVEEVGFRSSRIRTFYNSVVVLPNAKLADAKVDNYGRRQYRRCSVTLGLTYDTTPEQMQAFVEGIRAIIQANQYTRKDMYEVQMAAFGASSLDVMVYFFFKCDTWGEEVRERHNVFLEIMRLARGLGVSFAFPTQSLHIEAVAPAGPRELAEPKPPELLAEVVHGFGPRGERSRPNGPRITVDGYLASAASARGDDAADG